MRDAYRNYAVLFVDDEEKALKYFSRLFSDEFQILTAARAEEAKTILRENFHNIGILITDQRMPEETGVKLLEHAREHYPNIIRLLTTAFSDLDDAIEAVNNGEILRYITKPWNIDLLRLELRHALKFFLLKRERDLLLKEKLNIRLRLLGMNRARDLIIYAATLDHLDSPSQAILEFLKQIPSLHSSSTTAKANLNEWDTTKNEVIKTTVLLREIQQQLKHDGDDSADTVPAIDFLQNYCASRDIQLTTDATLPELPVRTYLFTKLFNQLVAMSRKPNPGLTLNLAAGQDASGGIMLSLFAENSDWGDLSILHFPPELLSAFFICYHLGNTLKIELKPSAIHFHIGVPSHPPLQKYSSLGDEELDAVFSRFETWVD